MYLPAHLTQGWCSHSDTWPGVLADAVDFLQMLWSQSAFSGAAGAMLSNGLTTTCRGKQREGSTLQSPVFGATERSDLGVQFFEPNMCAKQGLAKETIQLAW